MAGRALSWGPARTSFPRSWHWHLEAGGGRQPRTTPVSCVVPSSLASHTPKRPVRDMLGSGPFHRPGAEAQREELSRVLAGLCPGSVSPDKLHPTVSPGCVRGGMGGDG